MKQLKRIACLSLVSVLFAASSLAEGAPASQFGVNNWPYRNPNSACGTTNQPQDCATATPAPVPSAQPTAAPKPTARPQPTVQPTAKPTAAPTNSGNLGDYTTVSVSAQEYSAWNLLNADREANGLAALPLDQELCRIARIKSCDMKTNGYFAHESPTYGNMAAMLKRFGYSYQEHCPPCHGQQGRSRLYEQHRPPHQHLGQPVDQGRHRRML